MARSKRTYQDRAEYQREYQKRWRASQNGKAANRKIYLKRRVLKSEQRQRRNERGKDDAFESFAALFNHYDPVSILPIAYLQDPSFRVSIKGGRSRTEWLSEPLPTWVDKNGIRQGGGRWNGGDFV